jgi:hypothetical protein
MKIKFQYPLYIPGIYQVYTASRNIHGIYMVYTDYIPHWGSRCRGAAAGARIVLVDDAYIRRVSRRHQAAGRRAADKSAATPPVAATVSTTATSTLLSSESQYPATANVAAEPPDAPTSA